MLSAIEIDIVDEHVSRGRGLRLPSSPALETRREEWMETGTGITGEKAIIIARLLRKELNAEDGFMEIFYQLLREGVESRPNDGH